MITLCFFIMLLSKRLEVGFPSWALSYIYETMTDECTLDLQKSHSD